MSLSKVTTEVKMAKWDRKYRCDTKGKQLYMKFIKSRYNRVRRHLKSVEIEEWEVAEKEEQFFILDEELRAIEEADEAIYMDSFDDWVEDYIEDDDFWWDEDPYYSKMESLLWEQFELAKALEEADEDDLEWAFSGEWLKEIGAA